ncbi:deoxyribodipyrimidine photolyase [Mycoplasmatota bacterium WC30]
MNQQRLIEITPNNYLYNNITYIMHNAFRIQNNHAIEELIQLREHYKSSIKIILIEPFDENPRSIDFFYRGIENYREVLKFISSNVKLYKRHDVSFTQHLEKNNLILMDMPYLKEEIEFSNRIKELCITNNISLKYVESNVLVPVTYTSNKEEYSARTIRDKIWKKAFMFMDVLKPHKHLFNFEKTAYGILEDFIENKLQNYHQNNDPSKDFTSGLSPYLKFGFISPLTIMIRMDSVNSLNSALFLEELIVRRELAYNFIYYNPNYYKFNFMTYQWAYDTMNIHILDEKEYIYSIDDYIKQNTHDPYFNTAMKEMIELGKMHGYMRMYWCKKIIEWSQSYEEAFRIATYLNNYYFYDGNTPNGYTGVAWCFGKHDRAWKERNIFGKIRYMNQKGLKRKFDIDLYVKRIEMEMRYKNENI